MLPISEEQANVVGLLHPETNLASHDKSKQFQALPHPFSSIPTITGHTSHVAADDDCDDDDWSLSLKNDEFNIPVDQGIEEGERNKAGEERAVPPATFLISK